jgi:hypothetical protein
MTPEDIQFAIELFRRSRVFRTQMRVDPEAAMKLNGFTLSDEARERMYARIGDWSKSDEELLDDADAHSAQRASGERFAMDW